MEIKLIQENEIEEVRDLIAKTARISLASHYPQKSIDEVVSSLNVEGLKKRISFTHFYVVKENNKVIGCGAIGPYWDSETESSLFTIFVDPDYQGQGVGRKIINTLESDEFFLRAKRIEIPASMVALPFYRKMGYDFKNGELIFEHGNIKLEKFR